MTKAPIVSPPPENDQVLLALQRSAALLDSDASAVPAPSFQQQARLALLQAVAASSPATPLQRLADRWGSLFAGRRLVSVGLGAALLGLVAVPAMAAPLPIAQNVRSAVGAAIGDVPALFTGAQDLASPPLHDKDTKETSTATVSSSALTASSPAARLMPGRGVTVSSVARSTLEHGEAHGAAVSAAAHAAGATTALMAAQSSHDATERSTATATADADSHGDAVSSIAHTPPAVGEHHGQQVKSVARGTGTVPATASATSLHENENQGDVVSSVARSTIPAGEDKRPHVSKLARGAATTTAGLLPGSNAASPGDGRPDTGNRGGAPADGHAGPGGKSHGR